MLPSRFIFSASFMLHGLMFCALLLCLPNLCLGDYRQDMAYHWLVSELGADTPDGTGVGAFQVEAPVMVDHDNDPQTPAVEAWMPNINHAEFVGKSIVDKSGATPGAFSGHATVVGRHFYGSESSVGPGITDIDSFEANHWLGNGFLKNSSALFEPLYTSKRVATQAFVGTVSDSSALRRLDWLIARDQFLQIVGANNSEPPRPLWSSSFNAISVGITKGTHACGTNAIDDDYTTGRAKPDIVSPMTTTSMALATIASCVSLLVEAGHENPSFSDDPNESFCTNRWGQSIYNAERATVIKAALLAGADRETDNSGEYNITDYRAYPENRMANGMDRRFGAGQANIFNSYSIIAAGEQNCAEDNTSNQGAIGPAGFDYVACFGEEQTGKRTASYFFEADDFTSRLRISLAWNISIEGKSPIIFSGNATLYDLDLFLYDLTTPSSPRLVAGSQSRVDNTENIYLSVAPGSRYMLQVVPAQGSEDFCHDFALAWFMDRDPEIVSGPVYFLLLPIFLLLALGAFMNRRSLKPPLPRG